MITALRQHFNSTFTHKKYEDYLTELYKHHFDTGQFRIAETPIFVDKAFTQKMLDACESIVDVITQPNFKELTARAIPADAKVPGDTAYPHFIAFDFGICENKDGALEPQLIEMQGFPTLFAFQAIQDEAARKYFDVPDNFSSYLNGFNKESYLQLLKEIIVADVPEENVILLEILPHQQKTKCDFYCTSDALNIPVVCITELEKKGDQFYYKKDGKEIPVKRIYNRIIFDDLEKQSPEIREKGKILLKPANVEWVPHPEWFYRVSKYTLPFIDNPYIPPTKFLSDVKTIPADLENYVLKPLFSFAGQGVVIDVIAADIEKITDPENWILQRKVKYAEVIETPDQPAKAEIRIFYFWPNGAARPLATQNLARLSKGKMIGVRYNKDREWVGGTLAFFEQ